jgi:hypothetical protein
MFGLAPLPEKASQLGLGLEGGELLGAPPAKRPKAAPPAPPPIEAALVHYETQAGFAPLALSFALKCF